MLGRRGFSIAGRVGVVGLALAMTAAACGSSGDDTDSDAGGGSSSGGGGSARGFDGTTIKVAGIGAASNFGGADVGAQARFQRANETDELDGIQIEYVGFADDKADPATATSEVRRLVTQEQVFAIVPDLSSVNPGDFLNQQRVPYVGMAFDASYCSEEPDDSLYGFGYNGCLVPDDPQVAPDVYGQLYDYVREQTGEDQPSIALVSNDNQAGKVSAGFHTVNAEGAGFEVVYAEGAVPAQTSDYSPYVQEWLGADGGDAPDAIACLMTVQCLDSWAAVKAAGFEGTFQTPLYADALLQPLAGTVASAFYNTEPNDGLAQMQEDLEAVEPGTAVSSLNAYAYFAADMFIQAVKAASPDITPESVQEALANQEWQIEGFVGPVRYPDSTVAPTPACSSLVESTGTEWRVLRPYACSDTTYPVED